MGTLVVVDVASHVVSQKSLECKLLSTVGALKHLFTVRNVLSFAVVQKLNLVKSLLVYGCDEYTIVNRKSVNMMKG